MKFVKLFEGKPYYLYMTTSLYDRRPDKIARLLRKKGYNVRIERNSRHYLVYIKKK